MKNALVAKRSIASNALVIFLMFNAFLAAPAANVAAQPYRRRFPDVGGVH
jgi:hypothetical protein